MSSISGLGGSSMPIGFKPPSDSQILSRIEKEYGKDASESVKGENGKVDRKKLQEFMQSKGISPFGQGGEGPGGGMDVSKLLEKIEQDFGKDAAQKVQKEDGSIDFDALKSLIEQKMSSMNLSAGNANSFSTSHVKNDTTQTLLDILSENDEEDKEKGQVYSARV